MADCVEFTSTTPVLPMVARSLPPGAAPQVQSEVEDQFPVVVFQVQLAACALPVHATAPISGSVHRVRAGSRPSRIVIFMSLSPCTFGCASARPAARSYAWEGGLATSVPAARHCLQINLIRRLRRIERARPSEAARAIL